MPDLARVAYHALFWPRVRNNRAMRKFASTVPASSRVIEFGSGRLVRGKYRYSVSKFFTHCEFLQTDLREEFGHRVEDITKPTISNQFDVAIASSVLEHVFDFRSAVEGIRQVLRPGGVARIRVPFMFPLHDEPNDYWRFTEHGLRRICADFSTVQISAEGARRAPLGYVILAVK